MLQDLIDSISDILGGLGDTFNGDDIDTFLNALTEQGIDLSNYTPEEIQYALDVALDSDGLDVSDNDINSLHDNASGVERSKGQNISFEGKMCPTRHGCTGATNCNYSYASYPG